MIRIKKSLLTQVGLGVLILGLLLAACTLGNTTTEGGDQPSPTGGSTPVVVTADPDRPNAPEVEGADHIAVFDVRVFWQDLSDNEDGFNIYRLRTDIVSDERPVFAGSVGEDETTFHDTDTFCGATYKYIIASFNEAGESPATACWQITLPPCQVEEDLTLNSGAANAYNYLARAPGTPGDFYMNIGGDGRVVFAADQSGQFGLTDFGNTDATPLHRITLPDDISYEQSGVPVMAGHRYVAQASDGSSLVLFDVTGLGAGAEMTYTVWPDTGPVESRACDFLGLPDQADADLPGSGITNTGYCISGDGVCDPTCIPAPSDLMDVPVGGGPAYTGPGSRDCRTHPDATCESLWVQCNDRITATYGPRSTWDTETNNVAGDAMQDCLIAAGWMSDSPALPPGVERTPRGDNSPSDPPPGSPTYGPTDLDCRSSACVPDDSICVPSCGGTALYPESEGWGEPVCVDTNGNGLYDLCAVINYDPDSPYFAQNRNWYVTDGDCGGSDIPDQPDQPDQPGGGQCVLNPSDNVCCTAAGETFLTDPNACPGPSCNSPCTSDAQCAGLGVNPVCSAGGCYDEQACGSEPPPPPPDDDDDKPTCKADPSDNICCKSAGENEQTSPNECTP